MASLKMSTQKPQIMGILNATPDSFSDGGKYTSLDLALKHVQQMIQAGADIIDIGGESTRPGAAPVSESEELERVVPIIEGIARRWNVTISVDTSRPAVMKEAVQAGAGMINDVRALTQPNAVEVVATLNVPVCLMHMQGEPRTMQKDPHYSDVVGDIIAFLKARVEECLEAGIGTHRILLDPGFGFGKTLEQNYEILRRLQSFSELGYPVLVGMSRKSMIGNLLDLPVADRDPASAVLAALAVERGAAIVRTHNVELTRQALMLAGQVKE